jgi:hypothetical protein
MRSYRRCGWDRFGLCIPIDPKNLTGWLTIQQTMNQAKLPLDPLHPDLKNLTSWSFAQKTQTQSPATRSMYNGKQLRILNNLMRNECKDHFSNLIA